MLVIRRLYSLDPIHVSRTRYTSSVQQRLESINQPTSIILAILSGSVRPFILVRKSLFMVPLADRFFSTKGVPTEAPMTPSSFGVIALQGVPLSSRSHFSPFFSFFRFSAIFPKQRFINFNFSKSGIWISFELLLSMRGKYNLRLMFNVFLSCSKQIFLKY